ncbi:MAG: trigger factor [Rhodobacteraceae bacterium]|nr:trigger factor [Paracoccaceae bacterium]
MPDLAQFEGEWHLHRVIADARAGHEVVFEGRARFAPDEAGLVYHEDGHLHLPGQAPMAATRRYLWRADGAGIAVLHADGRPFHVIAPGDRPAVAHDCAPDLYRGAYDFTGWPAWSSHWRVTGPRKDYTMRSDYVR